MTRKSILEEDNAKAFSIKFTEALERWIVENKLQQKDFQTKMGVSRNTITNWKKGIVPKNPELIKRLCSVLEVPPYYFRQESHSDLYKNSSEYMNTEVAPDLVEYMKRIGLKESFLNFTKGTTDFSTKFPSWVPIELEPNGDIFNDSHPMFFRNYESLTDSAKMDPAYKALWQFNKNGKTITLSNMDLLFLKYVQDEVQKKINELFDGRRLEMEKEVRDATEKNKVQSKEGTVFKIDNSIICKCDKYYSKAKKLEEEYLNGKHN